MFTYFFLHLDVVKLEISTKTCHFVNTLPTSIQLALYDNIYNGPAVTIADGDKTMFIQPFPNLVESGSVGKQLEARLGSFSNLAELEL